MAVIVEMNEPTCCRDCYLSAGYGCEIKGRVLTNKEMGERQPDCPVRSVEGLLKEIEKEYKHGGAWDYDYYHGIKAATQTIKKYCGMDDDEPLNQEEG